MNVNSKENISPHPRLLKTKKKKDSEREPKRKEKKKKHYIGQLLYLLAGLAILRTILVFIFLFLVSFFPNQA